MSILEKITGRRPLLFYRTFESNNEYRETCLPLEQSMPRPYPPTPRPVPPMPRPTPSPKPPHPKETYVPRIQGDYIIDEKCYPN